MHGHELTNSGFRDGYLRFAGFAGRRGALQASLNSTAHARGSDTATEVPTTSTRPVVAKSADASARMMITEAVTRWGMNFMRPPSFDDALISGYNGSGNCYAGTDRMQAVNRVRISRAGYFP